jgi:hypothetical protein
MSKYAPALVLAAIVLSFAINCLAFGGLARTPDLGPLFRESAQREAVLGTVYMVIGEKMLAIPALDRIGQSLALSAYGDGYAEVRATPSAAMDIISTRSFNGAHAFLKANYWAPLVLFVLWFVVRYFAPRDVHLVRKTR